MYHWVDYPDLVKELKIVNKHLPDIDQKLSEQIVRTINVLRNKNLEKSPGISETLDWAMSLHALGKKKLDAESFALTQGSVLKSFSDNQKINTEGVSTILEEANG